MPALDLSALRRLPRHRPPVVLLGGINVVRALGLGRIPVVVASPDDDEPAIFSRYCVARWVLPPLHDANAFVESLESLAARLKGIFHSPVPLFFSNDEYLRLVNDHRARLSARFRMMLNDPLTTQALLDKDRFAEFAAHRGLPVARALDWERDLAQHPGPVLIKPVAKPRSSGAPAFTELFGGSKAVIRASGAIARADPALQAAWRHVVFQEYIAGDDRELWCFDAVADGDGRILACHTGRKLRCSPPLTGDSSYIELRRNPELESAGRDIAAALRLKGIFNMDFKRDASSGRYCLLEINARCNLWNYIGARNGLNLAKVLYDHLVTGARPSRVSYRQRYRWLDFKLDRAAYRALAREGRIDRGRWVRSLMAPKIYSVFAWRDPNPMLQVLLRRIARRVTRGEVARIPLAGL